MAKQKQKKKSQLPSVQAAQPAPRNKPWRIALGASAIVLLTLAAYYPLHLAGYFYDDNAWLLGNSLIRSWSGLIGVWIHHIDLTQYYPMVFVIFDLAYHLWGFAALGYHLMNVLFQAVNALLLWALLNRLGLKSAWLAAVVFAIHPVQVETVGWVVELKNILSVFFYLLAILAYLRFSGVADGSPPEQNPPAYRNYLLYALALLFYLLALFSKSDTCTLPAAILILIWFKRGRCAFQDIFWTLPMFIMGVILAIVTIYVEHNMTGIQGSDWQFTLSQKGIIAGKALWFYAYKIFWPGTLLPIYPRWPVAQLGGWEWLYPLAFFFVAAVLWLLQKKIGRGPFAAVAFFVVTLSPVLGLIPYYTMLLSFVADHFQYLACIGLIALAAEFLWCVVHWLPERYGQLYFVAAGAIIISIGTLTFAQSSLYKSPLDLWQYAHEKNPDSFYVTSIYGASLLDAGYVGPALQELQQADQMYPGYRATESALGVAYMDVGAYELAQKYFILAMEQDPYTTYNLDRAVACSLALRDYSKAIEILRIGLSYNKNYAPGWLSLARLYELTGQHALALQCYQTAVTLDPDYRGASLIVRAPASSAPANNGH